MSSPSTFSTTADVAEDSFAGALRLATAEDWDASVNHRFVDELFDGTLSDEVLARYLVQDYQFFDAFVAMLAPAWPPPIPSRRGCASLRSSGCSPLMRMDTFSRASPSWACPIRMSSVRILPRPRRSSSSRCGR